MIAPYYDEQKRRTAADRLAGDAATEAIERVQHLVRQARARLDVKLSKMIAEAVTPVEHALADIEHGVRTYDPDR